MNWFRKLFGSKQAEPKPTSLREDTPITVIPIADKTSLQKETPSPGRNPFGFNTDRVGSERDPRQVVVVPGVVSEDPKEPRIRPERRVGEGGDRGSVVVISEMDGEKPPEGPRIRRK